MKKENEIAMGQVVLNVNNLEKVSQFYQSIIGLRLVKQTKNHHYLSSYGADQVLVELIQTDQAKENTYGLYHLAIVVPKRVDLGNFLTNAVRKGVPLQGAADHGYSEAIYLPDPEGNGIEVYFDKEQNQWDVQEDGTIRGYTYELDAQAIYEMATLEKGDSFKMPSGSKMGHVHLSVGEAQVASASLQKLLDMKEQMAMEDASWISHGFYHHHLAVNAWKKGAKAQESNLPGLAYFVIKVYSDDLYQMMIKQIKSNTQIAQVVKEEKNSLQFRLLPDGIGIQLSHQKKGLLDKLLK